MRRITIAALAIVAMVGCSKEDGSVDVASDVAVSFVASQIGTRASSDWAGGEQVGIFMYAAGETSKGSFDLSRENVLHESDDSGDFSTTYPIYYPQSSSVDFYAYCPYTGEEGDSSLNYTVDLTDQNPTGGFDHAAVDFMTASTKGKTKSDGAVTFTFYHELSMVTFVLEKGLSLETLRDVEVSIGVNTVGVFSIVDGSMSSSSTSGSIKFMTEETAWEDNDKVNGAVTELKATAILLPEKIIDEAVITFKVSDTESYTASFPVTPTFAAGYNHTYNIEVGYASAEFGSATIDQGWVDDNSSADLDAEESNGLPDANAVLYEPNTATLYFNDASSATQAAAVSGSFTFSIVADGNDYEKMFNIDEDTGVITIDPTGAAVNIDYTLGIVLTSTVDQSTQTYEGAITITVASSPD